MSLKAAHPARRRARVHAVALAVAAAASAGAWAQMQPLAPLAGTPTTGMPAAPGAGGAGAGGRGFTSSFDTSLSVRHLEQPGLADADELVLQLRPGFRWNSRSGPLRGNISYGLDAIRRQDAPREWELRNGLSSALTLQVVEGRFFIESSASVSQSSLDPLGTQAVDPGVERRNSVEVASLGISPTLLTQLGEFATLEARASVGATNTRRSKAGDSTSEAASVALRSLGSRDVVGWGLEAQTQSSEFRLGGKSDSERWSASVTLRPDVEWSVSLRGGEERNDLATSDDRIATWGVGLRWQPTPRTVLGLEIDDRFFGDSRRFLFEHRFPLASIRFSSTRDIAESANPLAVGRPVTIFDQLFFQLASQLPDEEERRQFVLRFLQANGDDPDRVVFGGFINLGASLQRRDDLSFAYTLRRLTLGGQAFQGSSRRIGASDEVAASSQVRQTGYNGSISYRLSPTSSISLLGSRLMTRGAPPAGGGPAPRTDLKSLNVGYSEQLGRTVSASINARYTVFNSPTEPYRESGITAAMAMRW